MARGGIGTILDNACIFLFLTIEISLIQSAQTEHLVFAI